MRDDLEGEVFCSTLMREDLEASRQPSATTTSSTSTMMTTPIPGERMRHQGETDLVVEHANSC